LGLIAQKSEILLKGVNINHSRAGLLRVLGWARNSLIDVERIAALRLWLKSMFKPMFQDYTKSGRIISFFMRVVLLIFKLLMVII